MKGFAVPFSPSALALWACSVARFVETLPEAEVSSGDLCSGLPNPALEARLVPLGDRTSSLCMCIGPGERMVARPVTAPLQ